MKGISNIYYSSSLLSDLTASCPSLSIDAPAFALKTCALIVNSIFLSFVLLSGVV